MTASSRQTLALTEWALQRRYPADADVGKVKTEREAATQAEHEKTSRLRSLRLAAEPESESTSEGARRASRALMLGGIAVPGDEDSEHAVSRQRFKQMRALLRP